MTVDTKSKRPAAERVNDIDAILAAMREAVREALLDHKRNGHPIAEWRDGRVVWTAPEDIPVEDPLRPPANH
jgi:hypothetical protein